jgi:hypothetical protein
VKRIYGAYTHIESSAPFDEGAFMVDEASEEPLIFESFGGGNGLLVGHHTVRPLVFSEVGSKGFTYYNG